MSRRILILLITVASGLQADALTYTLAPTSGGFSYNFTLSNTGSTGGTLFDLFLSLPTDIVNINTGSIGTPVGWGDSYGGLLFFGPDVSPSTSFIEWAADFSGQFDLGIGNSLSGFSFIATKQVGSPIRFALNGSATFAAAQPAVVVPEPGITVPIGVALFLLGAFRLRHTRRFYQR